MSASPRSELEDLIGEEALFYLAEAFGGTRLVIPARLSSSHRIAKAIGIEAAQKLVDRYAPDVVNVPLAREQRARRHRGAGKSHAQIARILGMTEKGVDRMFRRSRREA